MSQSGIIRDGSTSAPVLFYVIYSSIVQARNCLPTYGAGRIGIEQALFEFSAKTTILNGVARKNSLETI